MGAQLALGVDPRKAVPAVDPIYANVLPPDASAGQQRLAAEIANALKSAAPELAWQAIGGRAVVAPTISEDAAAQPHQPEEAIINPQPVDVVRRLK
jgi:hypothetical protein